MRPSVRGNRCCHPGGGKAGSSRRDRSAVPVSHRRGALLVRIRRRPRDRDRAVLRRYGPDVRRARPSRRRRRPLVRPGRPGVDPRAGSAVLLNLRVMHRRVPEGAVWQSGFEDHDFFVSGPLSSHRYSYELVRSVVTRGDFVFVLRGNAAMLGYPRALFPDHELARLFDHASRQPRPKTRARTVIVLVACAVMLGVVVARAPVHRDAPDYENAAAIAQARHAAEVRCSYRSLTGPAALHATSAGECTGDHFVVQMYVYDGAATAGSTGRLRSLLVRAGNGVGRLGRRASLADRPRSRNRCHDPRPSRPPRCHGR
jgi:hypothetical protein